MFYIVEFTNAQTEIIYAKSWNLDEVKERCRRWSWQILSVTFCSEITA